MRWDAERAIAEYQTFYRPVAGGETFSASARITFPPQEQIARLIAAAGLPVDHWYGDWEGHDWHPESREILPLGSRA